MKEKGKEKREEDADAEGDSRRRRERAARGRSETIMWRGKTANENKAKLMECEKPLCDEL